MAIDLKLDSTTHDLVIASGDLATVTESEEVGQHIKIRLLMWLGEWILDFSEGTDWLGRVFTVHTSQEKRDKHIKDRITGTPGFKDLTKYEFGMDYAAHGASIEFEGTTEWGEIYQEIKT